MGWELGLQGLGIVVGMAIIFGVVAQIVLGGWSHSRWIWLAGMIGWVVGALLMSEVLFADATVDEIQPIIDGLALDESMLGGLIGGVVASLGLAWFAHRPAQHPGSHAA